MSKRFMRFAEQWIADNVRPATMDSFDQAADAWVAQCVAEAANGGFSAAEIQEEKASISAKIVKALAAEHVPDLDRFRGGDY